MAKEPTILETLRDEGKLEGYDAFETQDLESMSSLTEEEVEQIQSAIDLRQEERTLKSQAEDKRRDSDKNIAPVLVQRGLRELVTPKGTFSLIRTIRTERPKDRLISSMSKHGVELNTIGKILQDAETQKVSYSLRWTPNK